MSSQNSHHDGLQADLAIALAAANFHTERPARLASAAEIAANCRDLAERDGDGVEGRSALELAEAGVDALSTLLWRFEDAAQLLSDAEDA